MTNPSFAAARRHPDSMPTRAIFRTQLRQIVPMSDAILYDMERRGDFPRRFAVTRRCVVGIYPRLRAGWPNAPAARSRARLHSPTPSNG